MTERQAPGTFSRGLPAKPYSDYDRAMGAAAASVGHAAALVGETPTQYVARKRANGRGFAFDIPTEPGSFLRYEGWEPRPEDWDRLAEMAEAMN